jgi:hypothetical protein
LIGCSAVNACMSSFFLSSFPVFLPLSSFTHTYFTYLLLTYLLTELSPS